MTHRDSDYQGPTVVAELASGEHKILDTYLGECASIMHLDSWQIEACRDLVDHKDCMAHTWVDRNNAHVSVALSKMALFCTPETVRGLVAHELMHVHLDDLCSSAQEFTEYAGGLVHVERSDRAIEMAVERLARLVGPQLPLPPKSITGDLTMADLQSGRVGYEDTEQSNEKDL